jgi:prolyl 4-hydroxylase
MQSLSESPLSGLSPNPSPHHLHGGWPFTPTIYNHSLSSSHYPPNKTRIISYDSPRIVLFKDFLSKDEVFHLITISKDMERSEVVADDREQDESRTSCGAWLNGPRRDGRVRLIQHRIHQLVGIPEEFGESLYVLRYAIGQKYEAHADQCSTRLTQPRKEGEKAPALPESCVGFLNRADGPKCGGPPGGGVTCGDRLATVILTLNAATEGGATVFPRLKARQNLLLSNASQGNSSSNIGGGVGVAEQDVSKTKMANIQQKQRTLLDGTTTTNINATLDIPWYCKGDADVLSVKTQPGDALLFWGYSPSEQQPGGLGVQEYGSVHAGCPPISGVKLIATRWIRSAEFH